MLDMSGYRSVGTPISSDSKVRIVTKKCFGRHFFRSKQKHTTESRSHGENQKIDGFVPDRRGFAVQNHGFDISNLYTYIREPRPRKCGYPMGQSQVRVLHFPMER